MSNEFKACTCSLDFETRHKHHAHPAMRALEQDVLGCDYGGTSWTTRVQADEIPSRLQLREDTRLLEIGAGTGWPGVYTAGQSGCNLTMLDLPVSSLKQANIRAASEGLEHTSSSVAGSGAQLPFSDAAFDAIQHSDVLCCLPEKLEMLQECRRVVPLGAAMMFFVIAPANDLKGADLIEAEETGPPFVGMDSDYMSLLDEGGWAVTSRTDLTDEYLAALKRLVSGLELNQKALEPVLGETEFKNQLQHRRDQINAVERGLLVRELFLTRAV
jgi:SAM-dependent methyltransferase